jgi:hypothetical protein
VGESESGKDSPRVPVDAVVIVLIPSSWHAWQP